ncbi:MAG TPA: hypothetical protein HPP66_06730 [Planctomycetes bacterium]|nr:hypothetical protein [Planctomycetota bacterium]
MKRLIFPLIIGVVFLSSCQKGPSYLLTDESAELKKLTPVCIVWYKPGKTAWEVNKSWVIPDNIDEMNRIKGLLTKADKAIVYTEGRHKLSLLFYDGYPENLKLWEVSFDLVGKRSFLGSVGASKELGELLSKYMPEERGLVIPGMDPNRVKRIKEAQEQLRKQAEQLKALKEAEARKKIEEPNQAEP